MASRKVYDEPNPFAPDLKRKRRKETMEEDQTSRGSKSLQKYKLRSSGIDVYTRHKQMINNYILYHKGATEKFQRDTFGDKNDYDIIRENHRFLWDKHDLTEAEKSWDSNLAKRYYDKLFKEYCIVDLSQYKRNVYAMRWRVEKEVFSGKGQFECGSKHCKCREQLSSWEVNFAYTEHAERKNALVKVRLCSECSAKLNYHSTKRLIKKEEKLREIMVKEENEDISSEEKRKKKEKREKKNKRQEGRKRRRSKESSSSTTEDEEIDGEAGTSRTTTETEHTEKDVVQQQKKLAQEASEVWLNKSTLVDAEKTVNDEFDDYLDDLLL